MPSRDNKDLSTPPELSKTEKTYEIGKKIASSIIPFGGVIETLWDNVIKPPSQRRLEYWIIGIVKELEKLKKKDNNFQYKNLQKNEDSGGSRVMAR